MLKSNGKLIVRMVLVFSDPPNVSLTLPFDGILMNICIIAGDPKAHDMFQKIGAAYQILSDENLRAAYDKKGKVQYMSHSIRYALNSS